MDKYEYWTHPSREYHKFNGLYYQQATEKEHINGMKNLRRKLLNGNMNVLENKKVIVDYEANEVVGQVKYIFRKKLNLRNVNLYILKRYINTVKDIRH